MRRVFTFIIIAILLLSSAFADTTKRDILQVSELCAKRIEKYNNHLSSSSGKIEYRIGDTQIYGFADDYLTASTAFGNYTLGKMDLLIYKVKSIYYEFDASKEKNLRHAGLSIACFSALEFDDDEDNLLEHGYKYGL
ncbi:MAG: hypothetical protein IJU12_09095 [Clostridia bacterium]|nr:hypothetical protein [Clostridia bacterium]